MLQGKLFVNIKTSKIIIKYYDYFENNYRNMMKNHNFEESRQIIITTDLIKKILSKVSYDNNYYIGNINFLECIEPDEQYLNIIDELNKNKVVQKKQLIKKLNDEIAELSTEKGNDIESIEIICGTESKIRLFLYSNGIITADTKDKNNITKFINDILDGIINENN